VSTVDRRSFVAGTAAAAGVGILGLTGALAQDQPQAWENAVKNVLGDAKPVEKAIIELPEIAESGNTVPFSIAVENPMTEADHVKAVHIIATGNPQPGVATFRFTLQSGKAAVSGRMRLARTQDVIAIAELSGDRFLMGKRTVKVTIGGCGG
jgi:sulfur-oxidizing protein SoxY